MGRILKEISDSRDEFPFQHRFLAWSGAPSQIVLLFWSFFGGVTIGNLMGQPNVWIRLRFYSDYSNTYAEGGYVDDVVLRKCPSGGTCLTASPSALPKGSRIFESPAEMTLPK